LETTISTKDIMVLIKYKFSGYCHERRSKC